MRVLVDCSNYFGDNENQGDKAIFTIVARRLRQIDPGLRLRWITRNARLMRELLGPDLEAVDVGGALDRDHFDGGEAHPVLGRRRRWFDFGRAKRERAALREHPGKAAPASHGPILDAIADSDLVFATGGGYFSDAFAQHAIGVLDTLAGGLALRKPAVMTGAGFEPVTHPGLVRKAAAVLPKASLIACRDGGIVPWLCERFAIEAGRVLVTGDDAVELAYEHRAAVLGGSVGVNLRQAAYSGVGEAPVERLRPVLREAAERWGAPLQPVPISLHGPSDKESIRKLTGSPADPAETALDHLPTLLQSVSRCRIIVTGSYHAAVFGLSQGIPVVALAASLHYDTKLGALARQFGRAGCRVVGLADPDFGPRVAAEMTAIWERADDLRPALLEHARSQIEAGQSAYRRLAKLL